MLTILLIVYDTRLRSFFFLFIVLFKTFTIVTRPKTCLESHFIARPKATQADYDRALVGE